MSEVLNPEYIDTMQEVPPSLEVQEAMSAETGQPVAKLAIEEIMKTDQAAAFEWPTGMSAATGGVTYTVPTGDA